MFLHFFASSKSKKHLANLLNLAKADGFFHLSEYEFLLVVARKYGVSVEYLKKIQKENKTLQYYLPKNSVERFQYWYDLMNMVLADDVIHQKEIEYCQKMAEIFGYTPEIIHITLEQIQEGKSYEELYTLLIDRKLLESR